MNHRWNFFAILAAALYLSPAGHAQDSNVLLRADSIEQYLTHRPFQLLERRDSRWEGDRTQRVVLMFEDSTVMMVKWAKAAPGGEEFNNQPRYELAAYQIQKLFLDEKDYVVPPTVARMVPLDWYRKVEPQVEPTWSQFPAVLVVLQYWLSNVTGKDVYDRNRSHRDSLYARHLGDLNLLSYLVSHSDANQGNFLISQDSANPRLFAVDNGVAFASPKSDRGHEWKNLRVDRLPRATVDRLKRISRADLDRTLGVLAQFEMRDGQIVPVEPTPSLSKGRGVRRSDTVLQLGLTDTEIRDVHARLQRLLSQIDAGKIQTF